MKPTLRIVISVCVVLVASAATAQVEISLRNWTVPKYGPAGVGKLGGDASPPRAFIGLPACRLLDTRAVSSPPPFLGPIYGDGEARNYSLWGECGVPPGADAVSVNITVTGSPAAPPAAFLLAFPTGSPPFPVVSTLNFQAGQTVANAAIVPLNASGSLTLNVSHSTHVLMDINGYFSDVQGSPGNFFRLEGDLGNEGVIVAENSSSGSGAAGVIGRITSTGSTGNAAGVVGGNFGAGTGGFGVYGFHSGAGAGVFGFAGGSVGGLPGRGVVGASGSPFDSAIGVHGFITALEGRTYGVWGQTNTTSQDSAGVIGVNGGRTGGGLQAQFLRAGVRGESADGVGVHGFTREGAASGAAGVAGSLTAAVDGSNLVSGRLGVELSPVTRYGVFANGDYGGTGAKYFVEPHPRQADMVIRYVALEGPESGTYFRGRGKFQDGVATIEVPEDFRMVTDEEGLSVQITPIGEMASFAVTRVALDRIVVKSSRNVQFFYMVNGVRRSHKHLQPVGPGGEYMPESADSKMPAYLTEVQKAMLVSNGTYRNDGTVNMETAKALGWTDVWKKREVTTGNNGSSGSSSQGPN